MRIPSSLNNRSYVENQEFRQIRRKYFLAFEGSKTEPKYFAGIRKYADSLGINAAFQLISLERSYHEIGKSNPCCGCLPLFLASLTDYQQNSMTTVSLAAHTLDWAADSGFIKRKRNEKNLRKYQQDIANELSCAGYSSPISSENLDYAARVAFRILERILQQSFAEKQLNQYLEEIRRQCTRYTDNDRACMIVDRDIDSFTPEQYDILLEECRKRNISLYMSNPCFEFWLLLHFSDCRHLDLNRLQYEKSYLTLELSQHHHNYKKSKMNFENYKLRINDAVSNAQIYCENIDELKEKLGTNVGCLITELMGK